MKDRHVLYATFAQHSSDTHHTPADLIFFISNPIDMPGHILPLSDSTIAWRLNSGKIAMARAVDGIERFNSTILPTQKLPIERNRGIAIISGVRLLVKHIAGFVIALHRHHATARSKM